MTTCPDCGERVINEFAHAEECTGEKYPMWATLSPAMLREMIQEEEEAIRGLDYMVTRHRTRLAWLRAVQRGTTKP